MVFITTTNAYGINVCNAVDYKNMTIVAMKHVNIRTEIHNDKKYIKIINEVHNF